jgi:hypothetical protein
MPFHLKKKEEKQKSKHGNKVKKRGQIRDDKKGTAEGDGYERFSKTLVPIKSKTHKHNPPTPTLFFFHSPFLFPFLFPSPSINY